MPSPTPDPYYRNEHARRAILAATIDLASELGYEKTTIEGIAKRAGVSKQTIYRWWPSKGAVVLEALGESLVAVVDFTDTGDVVADFRTELTAIMNLFSSPGVGTTYRGFLVAAQSDPTLSQTFREQVVDPATQACLRRLATAREQGQIRPDIDDYTLVDMLYGAILRRVLLGTRPLHSDQIEASLKIAFEGAGQPSAAVRTAASTPS